MTAETNYQQKLGLFTIKRAMLAFGVLATGALTLLSVDSYKTIKEIMVGGETYSHIIDGKDLIADILPPPLYPVDAYARVHILEGDTSRLPDLKASLVQYKKDYQTRMSFWEERMKSSKVIQEPEWVKFHDELKTLNDNFWSELEGSFLPAVERADVPAKEASLAKLTIQFEKMHDYLSISTKQISSQISRSQDEAVSLATSKQWSIVYESIGIIAALLIMLFAAQHFVVRAITEISTRMRQLAGGALETEVPYLLRKDEVGQMARALSVFKDHAAQNRDNAESNAQVIEKLGKALENLSSGNLTYRIEQAFPGELDRLRDFFNSTADSLAETITNVKRGTDGIKSGTEEIAQASDDLSRRTENQAANLEETAAAVAEITATVKKTAAGAVHARGVVTAAKDQADRSGEVVRKAVEAMQGIEKSSQKITQIIGVIDEIAFQTNLLALNAGVEAARAGDAGRGFAVVASEVRALAQRSADAAKEIKSLLSTSASQVEQGAQLVAETGMSLKEIIGRVAEINGIVVEIASSAEQQATGLQEVNTAVDQMDQVTQQNAAMVEEATAATRTLTQQSGELARLVSRFTVAANSVIGQALGAARHTPAPRASVPQYTAAPKRAAAGASTDAGWEEF